MSRVDPGQELAYLDWNNSLELLQRSYDAGLFVLIIGPKGTGKTTLVRRFSNLRGKELFTINFSLRTRESHLVGSPTLGDGQVDFVEGVLLRSMKSGGLLYLDEINAAEADVLLRLDEALDDRRQIVLKEAGGQVVKADPEWFVIGTINPLSHVGTKEMPPQLLSRFPVRIRLSYPPEDIEFEIIKTHVSFDDQQDPVRKMIRLANTLREAASVEELYYGPSIRETIAFAKLIKKGVKPRDAAESIFANVYEQWGETEYRKVIDLITSIFGSA
ncbi:MAG: AAA family ATPase [Nitrososphaerales archaeon]